MRKNRAVAGHTDYRRDESGAAGIFRFGMVNRAVWLVYKIAQLWAISVQILSLDTIIDKSTTSWVILQVFDRRGW